MPPFPYCGRFTEPVPGELWSCFNEDDDKAGCGANCRPCGTDANFAGFHGAWIFGFRWLRPSVEFDSRDAEGRFHFPRSGDIALSAHLYPAKGGNFEAALCWRQEVGGRVVREYFQFPAGDNYSLCDCGTGENVCAVEDNGRFLDGDLATCFIAYAGWPPGGPFIGQECTGKFTPDRPIAVRFVQSGFNNTAIINFGSEEDRLNSHGCSIDHAAQCWGHRVADAYGCSAVSPDDYYESVLWPSFDFLHVKSFDCAFGGSHPEDMLRNMALTWLKADVAAPGGRTKLDQLDSARRGDSAAGNHNGALNRFGRGWFAGDPFEQVTVVDFSHSSGRIAPLLAVPSAFYTVTENVPDRATSDVTIKVDAKGNFATTFTGIVILINGTVVGEVFAEDIPTTCIDESETFTVPRETWDSLVTTNQFTVEISNAGTIASTCDGETYSETTISYTGENVTTQDGTYENIPAVAQLTGRTRKGGFEVTGEYIIIQAELTVFLMLPTRYTKQPLDPGAGGGLGTVVHATVHLELTMGVRADVAAFNAQGHQLIQSWKDPADRPPGIPVRMSNNQIFKLNNMPSIDGGTDVVDWFLPDGKCVNVPTKIKWLGHMGYTSEEPPQPVPNNNGCEDVLDSLRNVTILSRASHIAGQGKDSKGDSRKRLIWTGGLTVGF